MPVSNLSPWQQFLSQRFPGKNAQFSDADLQAAADAFFGPIPIPPGSQVISRSGSAAEYIDPEGFRHVIRRSLDGRDPNAGQISDNTNRPNVLPAAQGQQNLTNDLLKQFQYLAAQQSANAGALARGENPAGLDPGVKQYLDQITGLANRLSAAPSLASLDPTTQALLDQISAAEQAKLQQQFQESQGTAIAQLYGNRTNQSSIGNQAIGQLLQQQGLVSSDQLANAAARNLQTRQYLTSLNAQDLQAAINALQGAAGTQLGAYNAQQGASQAQMNALNDLLKQFTGQQTQRDIASAGLSQEQRELEERRRQANLGFELNQQQADQALAASRNGFAKQLLGSILGSGLNILSGRYAQP